jgi:hypothetical protein
VAIPFKPYPWLLFLGVSVLLGLQVMAVWAFTIDDMYIPLRYAKHWANGLGLLWNVTEPPVEGYSNFTFVVLASLSLLLHLDPVIVLKLAGVLGLLTLVVALYGLTRLWVPSQLAYWPCIWLLAYRGQILWSVSGLETSVYQALLVTAFYLLLKAKPKDGLSGILFAIASMTRPEAPALVLLCTGLLIQQGMPIRRFVTAFSVCFLPYLFCKWFYYGQLLPNPVHCKAFNALGDLTLDLAYVRLLMPFALSALPAIIYGVRGGPRLIWLWSPSVLYLVLCLGADPIVAFENRLFLPAWALFLPCSLLGLQYCLTKSWQVSLAALCLLAVEPFYSYAQYQQFTKNPQAGEQLRGQVVEWLAHHTHPGDTVVLADSGLIPYRSDLLFKDSYCLNNQQMTRLPHASRYTEYCQQVLAEAPEVIILTAEVSPTGTQYSPVDACLHAALQHSVRYTQQAQLHSVTSATRRYQYSIYQRGSYAYVF